MSANITSNTRSRERMLAQMYASDPTADGQFITGVLTTGIYCLPSCRARKPRPENVRFFATEAEARAAGLRPCRRCRPHHFYERYDPDVHLVTALVHRLRREPAAFAGLDVLVRRSGVGATKLHALFRKHFHTTPAAYLSRARIEAATAHLADRQGSVDDVAFALGFGALSTFYDQFRRWTGLAPGEYRRLGESPRFRLRLPPGYRPEPAFGMLARDPASRVEGARGPGAFKVLRLDGAIGVLRIEVKGGVAECWVDARGSVGPADMRAAHAVALRLLGLGGDPEPFERRAVASGHARLVHGRTGLRVPLTADLWEALVWAVIGQQINLPFACALRRSLVELCGESADGGLRAHPSASAVAHLDPADLRRLRFSERKAEYLVGLAREIVSGRLSLEALERATASDADRRLQEVRGIGAWSAQYVLMRGIGFGDCVPQGDSALSAALQRYDALDHRPTRPEVAALMERFAPFRSLATYHLWQSLSHPSPP